MSSRDRVPDVLPFTKADLRLPMIVRKGQRNSISGVQSKVLLSMFRDQDFMAPEFEAHGYYSMPDFMVLGRAYGVDEKAVVGIVGEYRDRLPQVEDMVNHSLLSEYAKAEYLRVFRDRLAMFRDSV